MFTRSSAFLVCLTFIISCTATPPAKSEEKAKPVITTPPRPTAEPTTPPEILRKEFWLDRIPVQGGLLRVRVPSNTVSLTLDGAPIGFEKDGFTLVGFDRDAPSTAALVAKTTSGQFIEKRLQIAPTAWKIENINTRKSGGAANTAEFEARRGPELARIKLARSKSSNSIGWRQDFIWPVKGRISGLFGAQRVYQGVPGSPHGGMDIAVPTGTVFVAPADGIVTLAAKDAFTLEGHLLMIDHGMGLNSAFLHCSELLVEEGQFVKQGQVIGKVGMTGRASGPHLHWGMKWNAARVDPKLVLPAL